MRMPQITAKLRAQMPERRDAEAGGECAQPRARRVPRPLAALLAVALVMTVAWTIVTPALQGPDENSHFGYVQAFAETGHLPGDSARPMFSSEQLLAASASNADQAAAQSKTTMEWSARAYHQWQASNDALPARARKDGGGPNPASGNPPLYYVVESLAYRVGSGGDFFTRLELARLASALWILVTVTGVWLLAGEVFARDRLLQFTAAGAAALAPMVQFVSSTVTPDAMLYGLWSLALWLGVRILRRGLTPRDAASFLGVIGLACCVKATSYGLLPPALFVLVVSGVRVVRSRGGVAAPLAAGGGALAATLGTWLIVARVLHRSAASQVSAAGGIEGGLNVRQLLSYVWQFYLPRLPFMTDFPSIAPTIPVYDVWLKGAWAAFGWLEVTFPDPVYRLLAAVTLAVAIAAGAATWRDRRRVDLVTMAFLVLVAVVLVGGLHWTEYHQLLAGASNFNQGRYLLPLIGIAGLVVAQATRVLPSGQRLVAAAGLLGGLLVLDLFSLGLTLERFYA